MACDLVLVYAVPMIIATWFIIEVLVPKSYRFAGFATVILGISAIPVTAYVTNSNTVIMGATSIIVIMGIIMIVYGFLENK